ncbi:aspartyl-phosphate phosphatase Spo0E family protein (plasmid) [Niallia sp. XMNu-256]|uniref:aspartyl-phosphate phosphatase Spo0E family protein n=1 Tax=Niallia sp. XMNu-256 TaxID=3082444 RepID=UPI0030CDD3D9
MCREVEKLERRINQVRDRLILIAVETGLNSDDTIYYSQKLDKLITKYQKFKMSNRQKNGKESKTSSG